MTDFDPEKLKHKPNEKHTLDEVLKSLQDLIHNDLLHGAKHAATPEAGTAPATSEGGTPTHPGSTISNAGIPFESVVESLEELVAKDLADDDRTSNDTPEQIAPEPESPTPSPAKKPDIAQQAFGFDDDWGTSPVEPAADAATPPPVEAPADTSGTSDFDVEASATEAEPSPDFDIPILTEPVSAERFTDDDIPVLEDVATTGEISMAYEIAERVVTRLNAERQARGEPALDAGVLETLRVLLREELERHFPE